MKIKCEICNSVIDQVSICPVCESKIDIELNENTQWVQVYQTESFFESELIKANLIRSEIPANILSQKDSMQPVNFGNLTVFKMFVPKPYHDEAQSILRNIINGDLNINQNE